MIPVERQGAAALPRHRFLDFIELMKPELTFLSVCTAVGGAHLAARSGGDPSRLLPLFAGTILVGGGAGALNMVLEHQHDARMRRTARRPIPSGRVSPAAAALFGAIFSLAGILVLSVWGSRSAGLLALITLAIYLVVYTPMKRITPFAAVIGAVPGALPPVIGWAAVAGSAPFEAWSLFGILFFWQIPHFHSLAWTYREDYARAGYKMLSVVDATGRITARQIVVYALGLVPASLLPVYAGIAGPVYFIGALAVSAAFALFAISSCRPITGATARRLFLGSLAFLPLLIIMMGLDELLK
jgi:protoheme IX farnesyltransferase